MPEQNNIKTFSIPVPENVGEDESGQEVVGKLLHSLKLPNGERVLYDPSESDQLVQIIGTDGEVREEFRAGAQILDYKNLRKIKQQTRAEMFGSVATEAVNQEVDKATRLPEDHDPIAQAQPRSDLLAGFNKDEGLRRWGPPQK